MLIEAGASAALVKGGHLEGAPATDVLVTADSTEVFERRVDRPTPHSWHRLHVRIGDRRAAGAGRSSCLSCDRQREVLCDRGDSRRS